MRVFFGVSMVWGMVYEGWRLGTRGLGAAGARGYFSFVVAEEAGLEGDFKEFATAATLSVWLWSIDFAAREC